MIEQVKTIAREAGKAALKFYEGDAGVELKADQSPLTLADLASHKFICASLRELDSSIPILSEESEPAEVADRRNWSRFWLIDPLDGTKEFIKKSGEFTVNIALIDGPSSVLGVVHAPVLELTYSGERGMGAFKQIEGAEAEAIKVATADPARLSIVASRDHAGPQVKELLERFPVAETRSMGRSLKFCLVAEGKADIYLRDVPTMEWDTGAAQCVVEAAGGAVENLSGERLTYNKEDLRNPSLVTFGDTSFDWRG